MAGPAFYGFDFPCEPVGGHSYERPRYHQLDPMSKQMAL